MTAPVPVVQSSLTQFPGVDYDDKILKEKFDALLRCCQDKMNEQLQHSVHGFEEYLFVSIARKIHSEIAFTTL